MAWIHVATNMANKNFCLSGAMVKGFLFEAPKDQFMNLIASKPIFIFLAISLSLSEFTFAQISSHHGAWIRGDTTERMLTLVLTGHEYAESGGEILENLKKYRVKAAFFFTGDFYRNPDFQPLIYQIKEDGHYLGAHSDKHLLYCDWEDRDSLLVSKGTFQQDLMDNYLEMEKFGVSKEDAPFFLPPYEWYNDSISAWTAELGLQLINFTPGTKSHADYTTPELENYIGSGAILESIWDFEAKNGLNGFILLMHIGVGEKRKDKFARKLPELIEGLRKRGYCWIPLEELLQEKY
ncbi:polysaccharide deacetylase family protein [Pleomorphovibrio marinus]|uniref:polysaccharide deacetylase family protein n=1 Tax=Pleomorphovibrio marinus TaxID=2164132 RepID=UPI001E48C3C9|nr:polysaccharide deacetylase family protein [Pleomorphovibrio marinus]